MKLLAKWLVAWRDFALNELVPRTPFIGLRLWFYSRFGVNFEQRSKTTVMMYCEVHGPGTVSIGANSIVGRHCILDGRAPLLIGRNVNIGGRTQMFTGTHLVDDPDFAAEFRPITIEDHVWIAAGAIVLPGVTIGRGAVVAAGSVVSRDLEPMGIYAGAPARRIGERKLDPSYTLDYRPSLA